MRTAIFRSPRGTRAVHCGCARRPRPAERRPQFISVTVTSTLVQVCRVARNARFRQSVDRNLFRSPCRERDSGSVQPCSTGSTFVRTAIFRSPRGTRAVHCGCPSARFRRSVDRNSFRSPRGKCDVHCGCPGSVRPYPSGITRRAARSSLRVLRLPAIPRTLPVLPPAVVLRASRRRVKRALLPAARVHVQNRRRCR